MAKIYRVEGEQKKLEDVSLKSLQKEVGAILNLWLLVKAKCLSMKKGC